MTLINNTCKLNDHIGIELNGNINNATLINNECTDNCTPGNLGAGIRCLSSTNTSFINNTCDYNSDWGIKIESSAEATLINNTCRNSSGNGISLTQSSNATLINNTCNYNDNSGIYIFNFDNTSLLDNDCNFNDNSGIYVSSSSNATMMNNKCNDNVKLGIYVSTSLYANITENEFTNNNIFLGGSNNAILKDNFLYNCGLVISGSNIDSYFSCSIENNWVNGKLLGFFTEVTSGIFSTSIYGQLILVECSDITISNQVLFNTSNGISIYSSDSIFATNNICENNSENGIYVFDSYYITLSENICNNNTKDGIYAQNSNDTLLINNECGYNTNGITLYNSSIAFIINNTCNNNENYGIYLTSEDSPVLVFRVLGIRLSTSDLSIISYNRLIENEGYGIYLELANNNLIFNNTFIDNNLGGSSQAYDKGIGNTWYNSATSEGNYWNDWSGTGSYSIDGAANSLDLYPLTEIPIPPIIAEYNYQNITVILALIPLVLIGIALLKRKK